MATLSPIMISATGLSKAFGRQYALRNVELAIPAGQFVSLIGPNGAGKTTLLRILAGLSRPTRGSVSIGGVNANLRPQEARRAVGFLSHQPLLYEDLTAEENLNFYGAMYAVPGLAARIDDLLVKVGLARRRLDRVGAFSRGMRQRLAIARALLHDPPVLLLDEPYTGLDQGACEVLDGLLAEMGVGSRTVVLTTHTMEQGLRLCSQAMLLVNGSITFQAEVGAPEMDSLWSEYRRASLNCGGR